jgi:hypothetical protein
MKHIKKIFESTINRSIVSKYLEFLNDVFSEVEDESGVNLEIFFYEFDPMNKKVYRTHDVHGNTSTFYTTTKKEFGYFSIGEFSNLIVKTPELEKIFDSCVKRIDNFFDHQIEIESIINNGFISVIITMKENLN